MIVGARPEHFEDAAIDNDPGDRLRFRTKVDVVESMGSELYVYFEVKGEGMIDSAELERAGRRLGHGGPAQPR